MANTMNLRPGWQEKYQHTTTLAFLSSRKQSCNSICSERRNSFSRIAVSLMGHGRGKGGGEGPVGTPSVVVAMIEHCLRRSNVIRAVLISNSALVI